METTRKIAGEGAGKVILFGEHAVVYGHPAVAAGLERGVSAAASPSDSNTLRLLDGKSGKEVSQVTDRDDEQLADAFRAILGAFDLKTPIAVRATLDIPSGAGLGSSAALATAVARALAAFVGDDSAVDDAVRASETVFHRNPSGIDQAAAATAGIFEFRKTPEGPIIRGLRVEPFRILVCRTAGTASTAEMVGNVRDLHTRKPEVCFSIDESIGTVSALAVDALEAGDWESVGDLMNINHGLLAALGVSTLELDHACHAARKVGALGAKLTGSGGGGCAIAIAPGNEDAVLRVWKERGWRGYSYVVEGSVASDVGGA